ncbi:cation diffusion facilitator family transporter [Tepidibacter formicigenes]|uniref:Cation diffusion facilitator family transporter n=1 Tax=Tepidibacter formicigenes DSM 15518 TaxID=1123349 RepID=A0A1M6NRU2_9FIRM|nr:cation diffusion facilitator family transporter [Tepidibacter formicigenes]SHJ98282.1 cation diffusion facilitator family transporter [Tepidibacter formicigenes DSM 15518]
MQRYDESRNVTIKSIIINVILSVIKVIAGIIGNSSAMIADGIHSASDIVTSLGVLIGNIIAKKPHDKEHNYGHEKAETLVAFILSLVLLVVGAEIGFDSLKLLFNLNEVKTPTLLPLVVGFISIIFKEYQYHITIKVANKINSPSLKADAWHHRSDSLSTVGALIGIGGAMLGFKILDPIAGVIVSLFIIKVGIDILRTSSNELMDYSIDKEEEEKLIKLVLNTKGVYNIKGLKSRRHGARAYVDLTICVNRKITVYEGHEIAHNVEERIIKEIENIKGVIVHVEPNNTNSCEMCKYNKKNIDF